MTFDSIHGNAFVSQQHKQSQFQEVLINQNVLSYVHATYIYITGPTDSPKHCGVTPVIDCLLSYSYTNLINTTTFLDFFFFQMDKYWG